MTNTIESLPVQASPEELQVQPQVLELEQSEKVINFVDQRGIDRRPHDQAPECYASDEIQQEVGDHFIEVDQVVDKVNAQLELIESSEQDEKPFNPLTEDFLSRLKAKAKEQLPGLTKAEMVTEQKEVTTGKFIKRTKMVEQEVERQVPKAGHVAMISNGKRAQGWEQIGYIVQTNAEYIKTEDVTRFTEIATSRMEELLVGEETMMGDTPGPRLPLLATKIREAGITTEQIDTLSWEEVEQLVPEAAAWFSQVHQAETIISDREALRTLRELEVEINSVSPYACETVATVYYDDATIEKLHSLKQRINEVTTKLWASIKPGETYSDGIDDYVERQQKAIANFFDGSSPADTILTHGTRFAPRIIKSGALKPAASMDHTEFTFNTSRTITPGQSAVVGIEGSRAVHWAGAETDGSYASDMPKDVLESNMRRELGDRLGVQADHPWVEAEFAKGGVGEAIIAMRLGDLVGHTPYGGHMSVDSGSGATEVRPRKRYGTVELTPKGWAQVEASLSTTAGRDVAYVAAPEHRSGEELYDYTYPLEELLVGIPSRDQDTVPTALRELGWSEEQIKEHSFIYDAHRGEGQELQQRVLDKPKYPHTIITAIAKDQ